MPAFIARASNLAANRAATFCTSSRMMKPAAEAMHSGAAASGGSSWAWRNLSPKTRQYVKVLAATGAVTDAVVLYNYPEFFGLKSDSK